MPIGNTPGAGEKGQTDASLGMRMEDEDVLS